MDDVGIEAASGIRAILSKVGTALDVVLKEGVYSSRPSQLLVTLARLQADS